MMNIKKSRKSIIALSVVAAFIFCSFATVYAFAANKAVTLTVDNIDSEELYKEIYDELVNVEKTLKDKFKDSDVTINLSESVDSIVTEEMRENIKNNETSYYEIIEKFKQMMEQFSSNINITTEEMFKQIYEAHPDAKEILDRVQKYWDNTNPVETFKEIYDKPVDLEYFKNWEGWEKEWEKYEKYLEEYKRSYIEKLEESSKKMEKSEEYEKSLKIIEDSRKQFEEMFKLFKRPEYWDTNSWKKIESNMGVMFQLKNGTEIETNGNFLTKQDWYLHNLTTVFKSLEKENPELYKKIPEHLKSFTLMPNSSTALMIPMKKSIVRLDNGITIETPEYTLITVKAIANADHEMEILIGNGNATITQSDGTSTTVPAGTVLDGEGNIIE